MNPIQRPNTTTRAQKVSESAAATRARVEHVVALAQLLERIEQSPNRSANGVGPQQYRNLVQQLQQALAQPLPQEVLNAILNAAPATAELYENLHYADAGLCRSPLEAGIDAEVQAANLLDRLRKAR